MERNNQILFCVGYKAFRRRIKSQTEQQSESFDVQTEPVFLEVTATQKLVDAAKEKPVLAVAWQ